MITSEYNYSKLNFTAISMVNLPFTQKCFNDLNTVQLPNEMQRQNLHNYDYLNDYQNVFNKSESKDVMNNLNLTITNILKCKYIFTSTYLFT